MDTYPARLFVMNMLTDMPIPLHQYFRVRVVELLTINTTCDFERETNNRK